MEVALSAEPTTKSYSSVEEHDESLVPKRPRGRPATQCWPSLGSPGWTVGCPGCDGRSYRHLLTCQQKRVRLRFSAPTSSRDVLGDVVVGEVSIPMEEVQPFLPPTEPSPMFKTLSKTDAKMFAATHPKRPCRTEFESIFRYGFHFEENTLEDLRH